MNNASMAGDRFFRLYYRYIVQPDLDTLFNLLNAIHSLNDRLKKSQQLNFFDSEEFIALKALRNLFHHQDELLNQVLIIPFDNLPELSTDMLYACLVPKYLVELSIKGIPKAHKKEGEMIIRKVFHWHNEVVNINPCVFNFAVCAYEKLSNLGLKLQSEEYLLFDGSYQNETANGYNHYIDGKIYTGGGSVSNILSLIYKRSCLPISSN